MQLIESRFSDIHDNLDTPCRSIKLHYAPKTLVKVEGDFSAWWTFDEQIEYLEWIIENLREVQQKNNQRS